MSQPHPLPPPKDPALEGDAFADEDADYELALKLSTELNGEEQVLPGYHSDYDEDADFAMAVQLHFEAEAVEAIPSTSDSDSAWESESPEREQTAWGPNEDDTKLAEYHPDTPSGTAIHFLSDLTLHLTSYQCPRCNDLLFPFEESVTDMFEEWLTTSAPLSSWHKCKICSSSSCVACTPVPFTKSSRLVVQGKQVSWCCAGGRTFLIWHLLCGFDQRYCAARSKKIVNAEENMPHTGKGKAPMIKKGSGVGFGGNIRHYSSHPQPGMIPVSGLNEIAIGEHLESFSGKPHTNARKGRKTGDPQMTSKRQAQIDQQSEDTFGSLILGLLNGVLPSPTRESKFDVDPPEAILDMLGNSNILGYCAELLRNDSLKDATKRKQLYSTLLGFLRTVGSHYATSPALFGKRPVRSDTSNLLTLSFHKSEAPKELIVSLADGLRNLNIQSDLVLQSAKRDEKDFHTEDGQTMLWMCRQISELSQYIRANMIGDSDGQASLGVSPEELSIAEKPDELIMATHAHASKAKSMGQSVPGRFKRLITEITTLKTGLPPGIFVRYCEDRPDVLKCAIIGPEGTPYENGIFEFDFFCDSVFPKRSPMVCFKGTGGGRVSINPNLYADGKVCLSLLGTWSGEPWVPNESTLLQILISLQAMILCEEPWYNEPGRELKHRRKDGLDPSAIYNQKIRMYTIRYAILTWLDKPSSLWEDVVDMHFRQNANTILQTAEAWAEAKTPAQPSRPASDHVEMEHYDSLAESGIIPPRDYGGDIATMLPRLQAALKKYGATYEVKVTPPVKKTPLPPPLGSRDEGAGQPPLGTGTPHPANGPLGFASMLPSFPQGNVVNPNFGGFIGPAFPLTPMGFGRGAPFNGFMAHNPLPFEHPGMYDPRVVTGGRGGFAAGTTLQGTPHNPFGVGSQSLTASDSPAQTITPGFVRGVGRGWRGFGVGGRGRGGRGGRGNGTDG